MDFKLECYCDVVKRKVNWRKDCWRCKKRRGSTLQCKIKHLSCYRLFSLYVGNATLKELGWYSRKLKVFRKLKK